MAELRRELAWATLAQIDAAVAEGRDPSNAVAFAALLAPFVPDELRAGDLHAAIAELSNPLVVQLHVTRRDNERLRYLMTAQRKLAAARRKGGQAELAGGRDLIDDAVLLYEILERAHGREVADVPAVAPSEGRNDDAPETGDGSRKRRRRRRGGRRRHQNDRRDDAKPCARWNTPSSIAPSLRLLSSRRPLGGPMSRARDFEHLVVDLVDAGSREHYADAGLYDYEYRRRRADVTFYRELAKKRLSPGDTILELGAGSGRVTIPLARDGFRVVAVDQSPAMLARLRARVAALPAAAKARVEVVPGDLRRTFRGTVRVRPPRALLRSRSPRSTSSSTSTRAARSTRASRASAARSRRAVRSRSTSSSPTSRG